MTKEKYLELRNLLYNEAQKLIDENQIEDANKKIKEIQELDNKFELEAKTQANIKALENKTDYIPSIFIDENSNINMNGNITGCNVKSSNNSIFLNKNEKIANRVVVNETEKQVLSDPNALGKFIKGVVTGNWKQAEGLKNIVTKTATGVLIPEVLSSRVIDLARDISLFTSAEVPIVIMDSDNLTISKIKTDPVFKFKKEGTDAEASNFDLDSVKLQAKTCYGYAYVTLEAIKSSINLTDIIYQVFSQAIAQGIDKAFLYGQENSTDEDGKIFAPLGILNDTSINTIAATTNGGYDDIIKAIGKIKKANGSPTTLGYNSETEQLLSLLKTTDGQYLEAPKQVQNLQHIVTNQLNYNDTTGSDALVFDKNALMIGIQDQIQIKIIEDSECLKKGLVGFQIYTMQDCIVTNPKHICKITGIK